MATKNISAGLAQVQFGYQDAFNVPASNSQPSIDRARGGIIKIKLTIPEIVRRVEGGRGGQVTIPARVCEFEIDLEQMPLVDVAAYKVEERQIGPANIPYPNGNTNPWLGEFK